MPRLDAYYSPSRLRIAIAISIGVAISTPTQAANTPNVVLIVCDDLNDSVEGFGGHPQSSTPHLDRLASTAVRFQRAYSNNPVCAPSRASFLTGIYPHRSGNLFWNKWFQNPVLKNSKTLMEHFRENGYRVAGSGKLMHHFRRDVWDEFRHQADYGPIAYDGTNRVGHPSVPNPFREIGPIDGSFGPLSDVPYGGKDGAGWIYGAWGKTKPLRYVSQNDRDPTPDERNAAWAADRLRQFAEQEDQAPFFLAVGFIRPHTPMYAPKRFFDKFPIEKLKLAKIRFDDEQDTHFREAIQADQADKDGLRKGHRYYQEIGKSYDSIEDGLKAYTQAYLACVAAVDECIGQVIDAVDATALRDNTIIIVTSDHGFHLGEKQYLFKNSPWEESCRVPLIVRAPGVSDSGGEATHPVSLIDLYPTLVDLCELQGDTRKNEKGRPLDGHSFRPFLKDPRSSEWGGPQGALSMVYGGQGSNNQLDRQHWTLRTSRWRYIRYGNGAEELYDHDEDQYEWRNVAGIPSHDSTKAELGAQLDAMIHDQ